VEEIEYRYEKQNHHEESDSVDMSQFRPGSSDDEKAA
jgi:hypothetical protein